MKFQTPNGLLPYSPKIRSIRHKSVSPDYFLTMAFSFNRFKKSIHITDVCISGNNYWYNSNENVNVHILFRHTSGNEGRFCLEYHTLNSGETFVFAEMYFVGTARTFISEKVLEPDTSKLARRVLNFFTSYIKLHNANF